jgi:hypothetical protein
MLECLPRPIRLAAADASLDPPWFDDVLRS